MTASIQENRDRSLGEPVSGASADAETGSREPGLASRPGPSGFDPARGMATMRAASDDVWRELDELRAKLRMVISHASGGHLSKPDDIERSINDICVEISRHNNRIWQHAQEVALRDASAIEAATAAETGTGSVHESATAKPGRPESGQ